MGEPAIPSEKDQEEAIELAHVVMEAIVRDDNIVRCVSRKMSMSIDQALWLLASSYLVSIGELDDEEGDDEDDE